MDVALTVVNRDVDLTSQKVLAYLKPVGKSENWLVAAWQACAPQLGGGSTTLKTITSDVGAYALCDKDTNKTATKIIKPQYMSTIQTSGNVVELSEPQLDAIDLTEKQSGVKNITTIKDMYVVWCVNGAGVCRSPNPMMNTGMSSFELTLSVYFTIGSQSRTNQFVVQNWATLTEIPLESNLESADIEVSLDHATNKPVFHMTNQQYAQN